MVKEVEKQAVAAPGEPDNEPAIKPVTLVYCPDRAFLKPYVRLAFGNEVRVVVVDSLPQAMPELAVSAVMISSTDIYACREGRNISEEAAIDETSVWSKREKAFTAFCAEADVPCAVMRCANVVGTGMTGFPMWLAGRIHSGRMVHLRGNEAEVSVVHAVDTAAIAALLAGKLAVGHRFEPMNITDGSATRVDDLIDALAYRLNDKHVWTVDGMMARVAAFLYDKSRYNELTTTRTFDDARQIAATEGYKMHVVTEYLRTHDYSADEV